MSDDAGPTDRPQLDDLVHRARTELRDWTDTPESDPGVALLELLALVGDLLSRHSERLATEAYLGSGHRPGSVGRRNDFVVEVDGHPWHQVTDLAGSGAEEHAYLVSRGDDGATVIEFGDGLHGQRPPSNSSIGVSYSHGGGYVSVLMQQGRVTLDTDENEPPSRPMCGVYRALVIDNTDRFATTPAASGSRHLGGRGGVGRGVSTSA